jgi:MoxR-like ATPase
MKINLDYPHPEDEKKIFEQECEPVKKWEKTETEFSITEKDIGEMIEYIIKSVRVDAKIYDYISNILVETRKLSNIWERQILAYGASTRAGLALVRAAKVKAVMENRDFVLPEDIKYLAHAVLDHRLSISYVSASEGVTIYQVTEKILDSVKIP